MAEVLEVVASEAVVKAMEVVLTGLAKRTNIQPTMHLMTPGRQGPTCGDQTTPSKLNRTGHTHTKNIEKSTRRLIDR
uniref:Uncharacterized protein n=1 Tax=Ditylenchus dipsaci TaxID=166011 RepID=A0A915DHV0_9BILA